jgi:ABC-type dipeptide/oligopeptide/nickel transport system permease subunit
VATIRVMAATLAMRAALGLFGVGVPRPLAELGIMVADDRDLVVRAPWVAM